MSETVKQAIDTLTFAMKVVGRTTSVIIDLGIYSHEHYGDDENKNIFIIPGSPDHPISLQDVIEAFKKMEHEFEMIGYERIYIYLGSGYDQESDIYEMYWQS